jgi:hypothetical protein
VLRENPYSAIAEEPTASMWDTAGQQLTASPEACSRSCWTRPAEGIDPSAARRKHNRGATGKVSLHDPETAISRASL